MKKYQNYHLWAENTDIDEEIKFLTFEVFMGNKLLIRQKLFKTNWKLGFQLGYDLIIYNSKHM